MQPFAANQPVGYAKVFGDSAIASYYMNSIVVTVGTIFFTLLFGAMAAWALTEYKFRWNTLLALLIAKGADVDHQDSQGTPLLNLAVDSNSVDLVNLILANKPDLKAQDKYGLTAYVYALKKGNPEIVKLIKDAGLKVQAAIMDDIIRVTGKKIDDLQEVIQASKGWNLGIALQVVNMKN